MKVEKIKQIILGGENVTTEFKECTDKISNSVYAFEISVMDVSLDNTCVHHLKSYLKHI